LYETAQKFGSLLKYSKPNLKNQKPIAVDDFFKAYPFFSNGNTLMQIQSGRTVPLILGYESSRRESYLSSGGEGL
jgi:hypothetical protein